MVEDPDLEWELSLAHADAVLSGDSDYAAILGGEIDVSRLVQAYFRLRKENQQLKRKCGNLEAAAIWLGVGTFTLLALWFGSWQG